MNRCAPLPRTERTRTTDPRPDARRAVARLLWRPRRTRTDRPGVCGVAAHPVAGSHRREARRLAGAQTARPPPAAPRGRAPPVSPLPMPSPSPGTPATVARPTAPGKPTVWPCGVTVGVALPAAALPDLDPDPRHPATRGPREAPRTWGRYGTAQNRRRGASRQGKRDASASPFTSGPFRARDRLAFALGLACRRRLDSRPREAASAGRRRGAGKERMA